MNEKKHVIAYVHTHWDREWYREFESFRIRLVRVVDDILNKLETGELPTFYFDGQTSAIKDYLEIRPEKNDIVTKFIKEKKLFIGPFYCSADGFTVFGESLAENLKIGLKYAKEKGCEDFTGYLCDIFGHGRKIPYLLKAAGLKNAVVWRGAGDLPADFGFSGIRTVNLICGYFQDILHGENTTEEKAENLKHFIDKIAEKSSDTILLPVGADHLKAVDNLPEIVKFFNEKYAEEYEITVSSPFEYFERTKGIEPRNIEGELRDNSNAFLLPGVFSTRTDIKRANVIAQTELICKTEPFQAFSGFFFGTPGMQNECDYVYEKIIKNHAHDSIYGCSTDKTNERVKQRFIQACSACEEIFNYTKFDLQKGKPEGISVLNLSGSDFSGVAKYKTAKKPHPSAIFEGKTPGFEDDLLYDIGKIPVTEDFTDICEYLVPIKNSKAFSVGQTVDLQPIAPQKNENSIENEFVKIEIKNGVVCVTDKVSGKRTDDFLNFEDEADVGDSYNFSAIKGDKPIHSRIKTFKTKSNPLKAEIKAEYELFIPKTSAKQERSRETKQHILKVKFEIFSGSKIVNCTVKFKNEAKNHILRAIVPARSSSVICEDLFGTIERKACENDNFQEKLPARKGEEILPGTINALRFVHADGICLLTKGLHEFLPDEQSLKITLLRSVGIISEPNNPARGTPAGPPIQTPGSFMQGKNISEFAFAFADKDECFKLADNYFTPPIIAEKELPDTEFLKIDNPNIKIYSVKLSGKNLLLRCANLMNSTQACQIKVFGDNKIFETDILEAEKREFTGLFEKFEIKTLIVEKI